MTGLLLQWERTAPIVETQWIGPAGILKAIARSPNKPLASFVVPGASLSVTGGDGIEMVGNDIRINIDELPQA